jgi:regulator of sirC expression with transglutaminase-like and TPR domain
MERHHPERIPSPATVLAAASLLGDRDPAVADACREQLLRWGELARGPLSRLVATGDARQRDRARGVLRTLDLRRWLGEFRRFAATVAWPAPEACGIDPRPLETGAMLVAGFDREDSVDAHGARHELERLARELVESRPGVRALARLLGETYPLTGRGAGQFDADATRLDHVLTERRGSAGALSVVHLLVGRRAGLRITGVQLPGHFLVRVHGRRPVLLDAFHGSRVVTRVDCLRYLRTTGYGGSAAAALRDRADTEILAALLHELLRVHGFREDVAAVQTLGHALDCLGTEPIADAVGAPPVSRGDARRLRGDLPAEPA